MVFSSITFLFYFLPLLLIVYYVAPKKLKNLVMFLASMVFYAWGEIRFIPVMLGLSVIDYLCARAMDKQELGTSRRKLFMLIGVGCNLFVLLFFKYSGFFIENINFLTGAQIPLLVLILPIGVSFNSFQSISYGIDVYRGTTTCEKSFYNYLTYTTLFPQIIAGPIVRYVTVENELDSRPMTIDLFSSGLRRFLLGLGKKVLIANNVGQLWEMVQNGTAGDSSVLLLWLGILAFTFQIYFDFSGYSDMAIGLAELFGFQFDENFNYPYIAVSITDFWRRWHMTLSLWFRDYIYIPLGGNRVSKPKQLRNLLIVWGLTGFWHGASWNFLIWGLYFALLLIIERYIIGKYLEKAPRFLRHIYTLVLVIVSWVIFSFESLSTIGEYLTGMFGLSSLPLYNNGSIYYLLSYGLIFIVAAILSGPFFAKQLLKLTVKKSIAARVSVTAFYLCLFLSCIAYLVDSTYNPFLYFRF